MNVSTSERIEHFGDREFFLHRRRVFAFAPLQSLRGAVRGMLAALEEQKSDDANRVSLELRRGLARLHFSPEHPGDSILAKKLLNLADVERKFGEAFREHHDSAIHCLEPMMDMRGNPAVDWFREIVEACRESGEIFRVLCPASCHKAFEDLLRDLGVEHDGILLHSSAAYRDAEPFDVLVRLGPIRVEGMGRVPPGVLTSPRYVRLEQMTWESAQNELEAGFDAFGEWQQAKRAENGSAILLVPHGIEWRLEEVREEVEFPGTVQVPPVEPSPEPFELERMPREHDDEGVPAVLITLSCDRALFFRLGTEITLFRTLPEPDIIACSAKKAGNGTFLVMKSLAGIGFTSPVQGRFPYAQTWKQWLRERLQENYDHIKEALRRAGVSVQVDHQVLRNWASLSSSTLNAPRSVRDRKILLETLGRDRGMSTEWMNRALAEIRDYRGERIQEGSIAGRLVNERLQQVLREMADEIRQAMEQDPEKCRYEIPLSPEGGIAGTVELFPVVAVEGGEADDIAEGEEDVAMFEVPEDRLQKWLSPDEAEAWRINTWKEEENT